MPKTLLSGSLEEQCEFLYQLALEKLEQGNYTGAVHALEEIVVHAPEFRDAAQLLEVARRRKREQTWLLVYALLGAAVGVGAGTLLRVGTDFTFLLLAVVGALIGYGIGNIWISYRRQS